MSIHLIDERGPTKERLCKAGHDFVIGGDDRTKRVYRMSDTPIQVMYARLALHDRSDDGREQLAREFNALEEYRRHWAGAQQGGHVGSMDLDRVQSSGAAGHSDALARHLIAYRKRVKALGLYTAWVVEQVVCWENSTSQCSHAGIPIKPRIVRAKIRSAAKILMEI